MKKKILISILLTVLIGGGAVAATTAYFSNRETSTGSTFTIGTLDLKVGDADGTNVEPFVISGIGASGDISGSKTWIVKNTGTLPGRLYINMKDVVNFDNGCNEPEAKADTTCANPGAGEGELGNVVIAKVYLDDVEKVSSNVREADTTKIGTDWNAIDPVIIEGGAQKTIKIDWNVPQSGYGNEIQSDSLIFALDFDLVQMIK
jgi:predicted ribosomally synthesized peptide with SipW-like signal peptide